MQDNLNTQIRQNVDKINKYGNQLLTLNDQIRAIESGGIEHANDLRDARNQILDELAELTNMSFSEADTAVYPYRSRVWISSRTEPAMRSP